MIFLWIFTRFVGKFPKVETVMILPYDSGNDSLESGKVEDTDYENRGQETWSQVSFLDFPYF